MCLRFFSFATVVLANTWRALGSHAFIIAWLSKLFSRPPDPAQSKSGAGACSRIALRILIELGKSFGVSIVLHHMNR